MTEVKLWPVAPAPLSDLEIVQKALDKQGLDLSMNGGHWSVYYPFVVEGVVIEGDDTSKLLAWAKQQLGE